MNVASLELCKELYELSGWDDLQFMWYWHLGVGRKVHHREIGNYKLGSPIISAYDLGYLLRKLPDVMHSLAYEVTYRLQMKKIDKTYFFEYSNHAWFRDMKSVFARKGYDTSDESLAYGIKPVCADTPEDAAAKLAIELIKQRILPGKANV